MARMPLLSGSGKAPAGFGDLFRNMAQGCALHEILTNSLGRAVDFVFLEVNPAFERLTGLGRDKILGRRVTEVLSGIESSWIETFGRVALTGEPASFERYSPAPLDRWYQVFAYRPAPRQFVTIFVDVTDRQRIEDELKESRRRYRDLIETTSDFIWETDLQGRYTYCSPQMEKLWGMTPEAMIGKTPFDVMPADERARAAARFQELMTSPRPFRGLESMAQVPGGRLVTIETDGVPYYGQDGRLLGFRGISRDVTDRKRAEEELRASEEKFRRIFDGANVGKSITLPTGEVEFNAAFCQMLGYTAAELAAKKWQDLTPPEEIEPVERLLEPLLKGENDSARFTKRYIHKNGSLIWGDVSTRIVRDGAGRPRHFITTVIDFTARKKIEEELERTNRRIKDILASIQDDFYVLDRDWRFVFVSRQFTSRIGREPKDFVGNNIWEMFPKHVGTTFEDNLLAAMGRREVRRFEIKGLYTDSIYRMTVFPSAEGVTVLGTDITESKQAEQALRINEGRLRLAQTAAGAGVWDWDIVSGRLEWSDEFFSLFGLDPRRDPATFETWRQALHPEDRAGAEERIMTAVADHSPLASEYRIILPTGQVRWINALGNTVYGERGQPLRMSGICFDMTERKKAEDLRRALSDQETLRLGAALEQAPDAIVMLGLDGTIRYANAAFGFINRIAKDTAKGRSYFDAFAPDSAAASIRAAMAEGRVWQGHMTRTVGEGPPIELEVAISAVRDPAGSVIGGLVTEKDVTTETTLQGQLRQSQKMEALGTLAGGIAHDFNNILNPIFISMELALLEPDLDFGIRRHLEVGLKAAERGRDLVKQVIAFSRQKEHERKPVEAAGVVREAVKFLRVTVPSTVEIKADIEDDAGFILGDPAQIQQIVMNLCANAAYAMRLAGGILVVSLGRVEADAGLAIRVPGLKIGPYVRLVVADTGGGMSPAVKERIFDPFFTTKGPGEGSGMGLPVVDGIVRSYDGAIAVESEEGRGSAFTVYLPRVEGRRGEDEGATETLPRGSGRILLIDDEEVQIYSVRSLLEKLGYGVVAMTDGREALERFRADPRAFDLVVTDQTMPHLTGLQLATEMLSVRPDIPIILCTGFSEAVDAKAARAAGIREFLMKPYSVREMAEVIRRALRRGSDPDPGPPRGLV